MEVKYRIVEGSTAADAVIEKTGDPVVFSYADIVDAIEYGSKQMAELKAQKEVADAQLENIKHFHPSVLDLTETELQAAFVYQRSLSMSRECARKLSEFEAAMVEDKQAMKDIFDQTGISQIVVPTAAEPEAPSEPTEEIKPEGENANV